MAPPSAARVGATDDHALWRCETTPPGLDAGAISCCGLLQLRRYLCRALGRIRNERGVWLVSRHSSERCTGHTTVLVQAWVHASVATSSAFRKESLSQECWCAGTLFYMSDMYDTSAAIMSHRQAVLSTSVGPVPVAPGASKMLHWRSVNLGSGKSLGFTPWSLHLWYRTANLLASLCG